MHSGRINFLSVFNERQFVSTFGIDARFQYYWILMNISKARLLRHFQISKTRKLTLFPEWSENYNNTSMKSWPAVLLKLNNYEITEWVSLDHYCELVLDRFVQYYIAVTWGNDILLL